MAEMTIRRLGVLSVTRIEGFIMLVAGVIIGVIYLIYNAAAGFVSGIKLELESQAPSYAPPPAHQWGASPYQQT